MDPMREQARVDPRLPEVGRRLMLLTTWAAGALTLALLVSTPTGAVQDGKSAHATVRRSPAPGSGHGSSIDVSRVVTVPVPRPAARTCALASDGAGYTNPLARARVIAKRIDQGVDYAGSGTLGALGRATITNVTTDTSGWHGTYIEYQLLTGRSAGCYVYYAEGVLPAAGLRVGQVVQAGEPVATIVPDTSTGIEIGWAAGAGMVSYAAKTGQWSSTHENENIPSAAGLYFSALIASLGGPPGKVEG